MPKRNFRRKPKRGASNRLPNGNGTGPSRTPRTTLLKRFQYVQQVKLDNATSEYAYFSDYIRPDITKATGASAQFTAYELWRLKKMKVSIQLAGNSGSDNSQRLLNTVANTTVWTAADLGANEDFSNSTIMQYQNAKRNTLNLNRWTSIVDTQCNVNAQLVTDTGGSSNTAFIMPRGLWVNTTEFKSTMYSGFQLFIQNFAAQAGTPDHAPVYQMQIEMHIEFLQPAFQNIPSLQQRQFLLHGIRVMLNAGDSEFTTLSPKESRLSSQGLLLTYEYNGVDYTFTPTEIKNIIRTNTADARFGNRAAQFDGVAPPNIPFTRTPPHTLIGATFTVPSASRNYEVVASGTTTVDAMWGNNNIDIVNMSDIAPRIASGVYTLWTGPDVIGW